MELNTADGVLNRIDRIVIRWDLTARMITAVVKSSAPSADPTAPALQRDADAYELCLADVYVRAGCTAVLQSDITDQRYNSSLCGVVTGTVDQIDASTLAKQFNDYAELFKKETKLDFEAWFEELRGILSEDLAGRLALAIDDINQSKGRPGGIATLNQNGKLAQMPTATDIAAIPQSQKGSANGVATLDQNGKIVQMPSAADIGARPSTWMPNAADVGAVPVSQYRPMGPYYSAGATGNSPTGIYYACEGITTGVYMLIATGNHNPAGSQYYKSIYAAYIGVSCGYNSTTGQVVVRVNTIPVMLQAGKDGIYVGDFDAILDDGKGGAKEIPRTTDLFKIFVRFVRESLSSTEDYWDVKLYKLI